MTDLAGQVAAVTGAAVAAAAAAVRDGRFSVFTRAGWGPGSKPACARSWTPWTIQEYTNLRGY